MAKFAFAPKSQAESQQEPPPPNLAPWLESVIANHESSLLRHISRLLDRWSAQDVAQESFLRLLQARRQKLPPPDGQERPWLFRVARNLAIDQLRRAKPETNEFEQAHVFAIDDSLQLAQEERKLHAAIQRLPGRQREVISLRYIEDLSYREISEVTGHTISYVGVLLHEALQSLRKGGLQ
jgi:RNA polymerase sigma-70 factor (ECF subfamily)